MPSFAPKTRVEVYIPIRYEPAYQETLCWVIEELTRLRGGCTVVEDLAGYYLSKTYRVIRDRVSLVYSDFPMNWEEPSDQIEVCGYCTDLKRFLVESLWEEEVLIAAVPVAHVKQHAQST